MANIYFDVGNQYNHRPMGRSPEDGRHNGERFRLEFLIKFLNQLEQGQKIVLDFDNVSLAGSSFLEEAFGGLVRVHNFTPQQLSESIVIKHEPELNEVFKDRIEKYIKEAGQKRGWFLNA